MERRDTLSEKDVFYYKTLILKSIKVGTEIEFALPKGISRKDFQPLVETILRPSRDYDNLGRFGVFDVVKEHCGIEVQIIGTFPIWDRVLEQYRNIIQPLWNMGVRIKPTCGLHFHFILEEGVAMPEIILANLWNLLRMYAPEMKFLTSGGDSRDRLCRRRQHNSHIEFMRLSPSEYSMREIQYILKISKRVPEHQNFFNLEHIKFDERGDIIKLHYEWRFPDGELVPESICAKMFLFIAMLLKSIELSEYGLLYIKDEEIWKRKKVVLDKLSNNDGELAYSDTSHLTENEITLLKYNLIKMIESLRSIFHEFNNPSYILIKSLIDKPISFYRIENKSYREISSILQKKIIYS